MSLPEKVNVTATMSVITAGPQRILTIAGVKDVTCFVKAEQKLLGFPCLVGERGPQGPVGNAEWGGITGDINDQTDLGYMAQVDDAPSDGAEYVRKNGNWSVSSGGGGGGGASWGAITGTLSNQTDLQTALNTKANTADLGDLAYDDSVDYSDVTNTPTLGTMAAVNDAASDSKTYGRKNGAWVEVTGGGGGSTDWGDIGGTLSDQTDLQDALDAKQDELTFDTTPTTGSTNPVTSGGIASEFSAYAQTIVKRVLYYPGEAVSAATSAQIMRIPASGTDSKIGVGTIVLDINFADPGNIASAISWESFAGYITFTGTCTAATTANVVLGTKG